MNETPLLIGIDTGFSALGLAEVTLLPAEEIVRRVAVVRTKPSNKKRGVRVSDDNVRRICELGAAIAPWLSRGVIAVCVEAQSWPQKASPKNSRAMAYPWGVVGALAGERGIPILQASTKEIKQIVTGNGGATKKQVQAALEARYGEIDWPTQTTLHEHAADALGAIVACLDHSTIQMARRMMPG
jgi:Holliday junction resolvasome RuvABC endonuclease subunit